MRLLATPLFRKQPPKAGRCAQLEESCCLALRNVYSLTKTALRFRLAAQILKQRQLTLEPVQLRLEEWRLLTPFKGLLYGSEPFVWKCVPATKFGQRNH